MSVSRHSHRGRRAAEPAGVPPLASVAEFVHQSTLDDPSDLVVLCFYGTDALNLGLWAIPPGASHPTDVLIGWRAPVHASAVGLVTGGEARSKDSIDRVRITVLHSADGQAATVLERAGRPTETIAEPPQGWGADALKRCLGLPTPEPTEELRTCVEAHWLRDLWRLIDRSEGRSSELTWQEIAPVHPLHPKGPVLGPHRLRGLTASLEADSNWDRMARLSAATCPPQALQPPGGSTVPLDEWFDAGSFAHWSLRSVPDLDDMLFEVLDELDPGVATLVLDALLSTTALTG